jgi:acyl-CoA synthetase (AMP-forming)/AMP-acid ligase II
MPLKVPHSQSALDKIIAWRDDQPILNREFQARIFAWRSLFETTSGEKFALYLRDSLEFASALFGGWLAHKIIYLPNNLLPDTCFELNNIVDGFLGEFPLEWSPRIPNNKNPSINSPDFIEDCKEIKNYEGLMLYTSGSTGRPQAIPKYISQLAAEISTLENLFGHLLGSTETEIISTVGHEHIYGLLFKILWPLNRGLVIHVHSVMFLEELSSISTTRDCVLISTPTHLKRFPENSALIKSFNNLNNIRAIFSSAGSLSWDTVQNTQKIFGKTPIEIYGSTETGGIAWRQRENFSDESWQSMPNVDLKISENILKIKSPHLSNNRWYLTADRAISVDNNRFILQGRIDRIVKLEGKRISLDAIERSLIRSNLIKQIRVIMLENTRQYTAAFIVLSDQGENLLAKLGKIKFNYHLKNILNESVERIALPRLFRYLPALPINTQGKTTNTELVSLLKPIFPACHLLEKNSERIILQLKIPKDLLYFEGHFPETPILPGVVQINWAIHYGREYFKMPLSFYSIYKLKFQKIIQPAMMIILELLFDPEKSILTFRFHSKFGQHTSGSILFNDK